MLSDYDSFIKTLESLGEVDVSSKISQGVWSSQKKKWASDWLDKESSLKRDAREEETLRIARSANRRAWAAIIIASIFSALSIIIAIIALCIKTP